MRTLFMAPLLAATLLITADLASAAPHGNKGTGSASAATNSNGIRSLDRDHGLERAADRRNVRSLSKKRSANARTKK